MSNVRRATPADRSEWLRMRAALWPHATAAHPREIDAYIEGWYVDPGFYRRGVGAALVRAAEEWARSLELTEIASDSELDNRVGQRAHAAPGFREVGRVVQFRKSLEGRNP